MTFKPRRMFPRTEPKPKRICCLCQEPIKLHDKYVRTATGKFLHRDCRHPEIYPKGSIL